MEKLKKIFPLSYKCETVKGGIGLIVLYILMDLLIELGLSQLYRLAVSTVLLEVLIGIVHVYFLMAMVLVIAHLIEEKNNNE